MRIVFIILLSALFVGESRLAEASLEAFKDSPISQKITSIAERLELLGEAYRVYGGKGDSLDRLKGKGFNVWEHTNKDFGCVLLARQQDIYMFYLGAKESDASACQNFVGTFLPYATGRIHCGFAHKFHDNWDPIYIEMVRYAGVKGASLSQLNIHIVGHSMGGALAVLAGLRLAVVTHKNKPDNHIDVVTFGSPRVFDFETASQYEELLGKGTWRIVHEGEGMIPCLPTGTNGSKHVGLKIVTPKPGFDFNAHQMLVHHFKAYEKSLRLACDHPESVIEEEVAYNTFGSVLSSVKNCIGFARKKIYEALAEELIEDKQAHDLVVDETVK